VACVGANQINARTYNAHILFRNSLLQNHSPFGSCKFHQTLTLTLRIIMFCETVFIRAYGCLFLYCSKISFKSQRAQFARERRDALFYFQRACTLMTDLLLIVWCHLQIQVDNSADKHTIETFSLVNCTFVSARACSLYSQPDVSFCTLNQFKRVFTHRIVLFFCLFGACNRRRKIFKIIIYMNREEVQFSLK